MHRITLRTPTGVPLAPATEIEGAATATLFGHQLLELAVQLLVGLERNLREVAFLDLFALYRLRGLRRPALLPSIATVSGRDPLVTRVSLERLERDLLVERMPDFRGDLYYVTWRGIALCESIALTIQHSAAVWLRDLPEPQRTAVVEAAHSLNALHLATKANRR